MTRYAVIMAGGSGTRLWPLSRKSRPKQLLRLFGGKSLLRSAYERLVQLLPPERICVITAGAHLPLVHEQLPEVPKDNLFGEPEGRDTAAAVGLSAAILHERDPDAVMGVFTADHVIEPVDAFVRAVDTALRTAEEHADALVTLGVTVRGPETAFGYVRRGTPLADGVYEVAEFTEKPDRDTAERFAASGEYFWNAGMFAWRTGTILGELAKRLPATHAAVATIARVWTTLQGEATLRDLYPTLEKISIDYAVMERASRVLVVEMPCAWADVGSWTQLDAVLTPDEQGNIIAAAQVIHERSRRVTVVSEDDGHLIATIGLEDVVVVHSPDATLICRKQDAQAVRNLLARVESEQGPQYL